MGDIDPTEKVILSLRIEIVRLINLEKYYRREIDRLNNIIKCLKEDTYYEIKM